MRQANGTGSVYKLPGNRRRPYAVRITLGTEYIESEDKYVLKRKIIGYYSTQQEARKALAEYNDAPCVPSMIDITFGEIWDIIRPKICDRISKSRMDSYDAAYKHLAPVADKRMKDLKTAALQNVIDKCPYRSSTKQNIKTVMGKVYDYALQNDVVNKDYSEFVQFDRDPVKIERTLFTHEEVELLWKNQTEWWCAMMLVLLYSGMRIKEFLANRSENIDLDNMMMFIPEDIAKNKSSARTIPVHPDIVPILERFKSAGSEYIAVKPSGVRIQYQNFMDRDLKSLTELLGARHTPHDTRHTFITRARECGIDHLVLQRIVGHTPDTITERIYTHLSDDELKAEIIKLEY